jgi:predicted metalloendopeptidase
MSLADAGIDAKAMDPKADPCVDFYQYACGGWEVATEIPADKSRWSRSFSVIAENNREELKRILTTASTNPGDDPVMKKIGAYYAACMDEAAVEKANLAPIQPFLKAIAKIKDKKSLTAVVTELHGYRVPALFDIDAEQDFKEATKVILYVDQSGIGMPDRDYYTKDDDRSKDLRKKYLAHVEAMFKLAGKNAKAAAKAAADVMEVETRLAKASMTRVERRDAESMYHRMDRAGLVKLAPAFPWADYFKAVGQPDVNDINVTSTVFLAEVDKMLGDVKAPVWKSYLEWTVLRDAKDILPKRFEEQAFKMAQVLTGQKKIEDRWKRCVAATDGALGELLAQPFVKTHFGGESKAATEQMITEIRKAFGRGLEHLSWMDAKTRERAAEKLHGMVFHIGFPDKWKSYDFEVDAKSYGKNVMAAAKFSLGKKLAEIGKPVDRKKWGMSPPTVNAYYNPLKNEMVFPAGILQPPFFSAKNAVAVNLGGIGMVVGHELTHGFDDEGSKFAHDGNLRNWWEPAVGGKFKEKTQCIQKQYAGYEPLPGLKLNGELTSGENIADNGGVKLAFAAYRELRKGQRPMVADGKTEDQLFFLAVGQAWCNKSRDEVARMLVQVDPHSPPKFRVNGSLQNTAAFHEAFQCKKGAAMNPANTCEVW